MPYSTPRSFRLLLVCVALVCANASPAKAQKNGQRISVPTRSRKQVLYDFRVDDRRRSPRISEAMERTVLSSVFRKYLTDDAKCNREFEASDDDPLKSARDAGQMVPSIVDSATGSFTAAGLKQTIYVISVSECNASHADNFGTKRVAIFEGTRLAAEMDVHFKSSIVRLTDLDGDGVNELLMTTGDMSQGTLTEMAGLLEFKGGRLRVIEDFGTVVEDSCAAESRESTSRASVISIVRDGQSGTPRLRMDNYQSGCRPPIRWRFVSTGKMYN